VVVVVTMDDALPGADAADDDHPLPAAASRTAVDAVVRRSRDRTVVTRL
jgi:hypothetical protein